MKNGSGHDFVHREQICQQLALGAVELFEQPQPEVFIKLVRCLSVDNVDRVDVLPVRGAIESHCVVVHVLLKMRIGLKGDSEVSGR